MQEEAAKKTIMLAVKAAKLDANILKAAMRFFLEQQRTSLGVNKVHGKTTVKELIGEGAGVSTIEISDKNIRSFERAARKYNVDFAVKKDKTEDPPRYLVFFKGKDADAIRQAFKEYVYGNEKKKDKPSIRKKLEQFREIVEKNKDREIAREKNKDRGQSL